MTDPKDTKKSGGVPEHRRVTDPGAPLPDGDGWNVDDHLPEVDDLEGANPETVDTDEFRTLARELEDETDNETDEFDPVGETGESDSLDPHQLGSGASIDAAAASDGVVASAKAGGATSAGGASASTSGGPGAPLAQGGQGGLSEAEILAASGEDLTYGDIVWSQFKRNKVAVVAMWLLGFIFLLAVFSPVISSDRPYIWTTSEGTTYPWFPSLFDRNYFENPVDIFFNLLMTLGVPFFGVWLLRMRSIMKRGLPKRPRRRLYRRDAFVLVGLLVVVYVGLIFTPSSSKYIRYTDELTAAAERGEDVEAVFPPIRYSYRQTGFKSVEKPSKQHILGVDQSTRDVAVRMLYGTRISLTIGVIAVSIYVFIGVLLGGLAGFFGGRADLLIQRFIEVMMSVPTFFVILTVMAFLEHRSIFHIMLIIGVLRWTGVARLVRGEFLRLRNQEFVTAAAALGYPERRIIFEQILPNALGPVLVAATFGVASAILLEAGLAFLGLGDISAPSWGQTLQEGYATGAWHLILAPGFAIFITVSVLNLVGEGLRDALDPKLRQ